MGKDRKSKTLIYIQEQGIDSYAELEQKCKTAYNNMMSVNDKINVIEAEQKRINEIQTHIGTYQKARTAYNKYRAMKNLKEKQKYYEANRADIERCRVAVKYFDAQGLKGKLPSITSLKEQWAEFEKQKRPFYSEYKQKKKRFADLCNAKSNAYKMLGLDKRRQNSRSYELSL